MTEFSNQSTRYAAEISSENPHALSNTKTFGSWMQAGQTPHVYEKCLRISKNAQEFMQYS